MINNRQYKFLFWGLTAFALIILCFIRPVKAYANTLVIPQSVSIIDDEAFYGDTSLEEVVLPEGIKTIGSKAFANSTLQKINLPSSLTNIASNALPKPGQVTVTAKSNTYAYQWIIENGYYVPVSGLSLSISTNRHYIGSIGNYTRYITIAPDNASVQDLLWTSSNPTVILITDSSTGHFTCKKQGQATITATSTDGGYRASCDVSVYPEPTGISLNKAATTIVKGTTENLVATVEPEETIYKSITWTSSDPNVATVDTNGLVRGTGTGTATITVKLTTTRNVEFVSSCEIKVIGIKVTGGTKANGIACRTIRVTAPSSWTATTTDSWLTLNTVTDSNTASKTITGEAGTNVKCYTWLSHLPTTTASRTGHIVFTCGDTSYTLNIVQDRTDAPMTGVSFIPTSGSWAVGETKRLIPTFEPSYATDRRVTWTSSNTAVASVDAGGNVKGISPGTANITVKTTDGGYTAVYTVKIKQLVTGLSLSNLTMNRAGSDVTGTITRTITPSNATTQTLTWTSSNTSIATVDSTGKVTGKAPGTVTITAKTTDGSNITKTCTVTVVQKVTSIKITYNGSVCTNDVLLNIGGYGRRFNIQTSPSNANNGTVTWSSSDSSVIELKMLDNDDIQVHALKLGKADLIATANDGSGVKGIVHFTIYQPVTGIVINGDQPVTMNVGEEKTIGINSITPGNAYNKILKVTSSNNSIVEVKKVTTASGSDYTESFTVQGKKAGTAVITVSAQDGVGFSKTLNVTVVSNGYDRNAAVAYAREYAQNYNGAYPNYAGQGGDCANFVTQCLVAGGIDVREIYIRSLYTQTDGADYSAATVVGSCVNALITYKGATLQTGNYSFSNMRPGDLWVTGDYDHIVIISAVYSDHVTICGHTDNELDGYRGSFGNLCCIVHMP